MSVGVALLLEYLGTVLVVGWLWLRHGQRPRRLTVAGAVAAHRRAGAGARPDRHVRARPGRRACGACGPRSGLAVYFVLSAPHGRTPLPPIVMAWAGMCVGAVVLAVLGWSARCRCTPPPATSSFAGHQVSWLVPVLGLSLVAAAIAYVAGIGAARRLGAKLASFVGLAEVLFAVLFAWLLLGQLPTAVQFARRRAHPGRRRAGAHRRAARCRGRRGGGRAGRRVQGTLRSRLPGPGVILVAVSNVDLGPGTGWALPAACADAAGTPRPRPG